MADSKKIPAKTAVKKDFSQGQVWRHIVAQAVPLTLAQLVHLLYNIVDRIYIGHLPNIGSMALTGVGLAFPLTALVNAFTQLFCSGGTPLFSIARGEKDEAKAEKLMGQVFMLLFSTSLILFFICFFLRKPILYLFGASDASYYYADQYLKIFLFGTTFSMISTGMNGFINAQGCPKMGMLTIIIGAVLNLVLDPLFIFVFNMGIQGAALATVLSQAVSAGWVMLFIQGKRSGYHVRLKAMRPDLSLIRRILSLGIAGFIMQFTNCLVQVTCNKTLRTYGGDLYVGIMTVVNSVREILQLPNSGITSGSQPVLGYNYGARKYSHVREGIRFMTVTCLIYMIAAWGLILVFPKFLIRIFTSDPEMLAIGPHVLRLYFFGFFFMAFQSGGQSTFTALGCSKRAVFFSLLRKVIIVFPLTLLLPRWGFGVDGVFLAEPISNAIGGLACFITMWLSLYRKLPKEDG